MQLIVMCEDNKVAEDRSSDLLRNAFGCKHIANVFFDALESHRILSKLQA